MQKIVSNGVAALGLALCLQMDVLMAADEPAGAPVPATPPFASPDIKPTLGDWITGQPLSLGKKVLLSDPLQKPPFAGQPPDSLKGMAAGIRAVQLDVPNRVKAAAYLGTVDCVTYPQAQAMLIATMKEDPSEAVRYEAVMALRMMLTRGCSNMDSPCDCNKCCNRKKVYRQTLKHSGKKQNAIIHEAKCHAKLAAYKAKKALKAEERFDCCLGCANEKVMKALAEVAYGKGDACCFNEPSERVREAAEEGLCLMAITADLANDLYYGDPGLPPTEASPNPGDKEVSPPDEMETTPVTEDEEKDVPAVKTPIPASPPPQTSRPIQSATRPLALQNQQPVQQVPVPSPTPTTRLAKIQPAINANLVSSTSANTLPVLKSAPVDPKFAPQVNTLSASVAEPPVVNALNGHCIVALKNRQFIQATQNFSTEFKGHTYYFSSEEARQTFEADPVRFAPAYGGIDPVVWLDRHEAVQGQFLREYDDRFYIFANKENWDTFKANPNRFILSSPQAAVRVAKK